MNNLIKIKNKMILIKSDDIMFTDIYMKLKISCSLIFFLQQVRLSPNTK